MTTFKYRPLCSILPLSRQWLLDDIILKKNHGQLDRVWLSPGHLFISLDSGLRIVTFDTRSVDKTQDDEKRCLDLTCDSPVLDILVGRSIPNVAYIIHRNGSVQVWKFRSDFSWLLIQKFNLCTTPNTVITDVCLHPSQNAVYWCESNLSSLSNATVFCIYKRQLPEDEGKLKNKELGLAIALVHNCPSSQVFAATHGLFIVFRDVVLLWCLSANRITVYTGDRQVEILDYDLRQAVDFQSLALRLIGILSKGNPIAVLPEASMFSVCHSIQTLQLCVVSSDGRAKWLPDVVEGVSHFGKRVNLPLTGASYFIYRDLLGIITATQISFFDVKRDCLVGHIDSPNSECIEVGCVSLLGTPLVGFCTTQGIYLLQKQRRPIDNSNHCPLDGRVYQTDALHIAWLDRLKTDNSAISDILMRLELLQEKRETGSLQKSTTKFSQLVDPYMTEYWRLEHDWQALLRNEKNASDISPPSIDQEVSHILNSETNMLMMARQAQLLILAEVYPVEVLSTLLSQLKLESGDDISTSQHQRWQCIMFQETAAHPLSPDLSIPLFEHICRLLYIHRPGQLLSFVKMAQVVSDQRVGVSAFIRKNQTLQFYERALASLPHAERSCDPVLAVSAYVKLLLASEQAGCCVAAASMLLRHKMWTEAIALLEKFADETQQHTQLFHLLLVNFLENGVLAEYSEDLFRSLPHSTSMKTVAGTSQDSVTRREKFSLKGVFVQETLDVSVESVRRYLLPLAESADSPAI